MDFSEQFYFFLVPDQVSDEIIGSIEFVQNYIQRYGEPHPEFYQGTLSDALAEACHKPAKDVSSNL